MNSVIEKISVSRFKAMIEKDGSKYTDEDVFEIREFLYMLAELDYEVFLKHKLRDLEYEKAKQKTEEDNLSQAA